MGSRLHELIQRRSTQRSIVLQSAMLNRYLTSRVTGRIECRNTTMERQRGARNSPVQPFVRLKHVRCLAPPSPTLQAKPCLLTGQPTLFSPPSHSRLTTLKARGHLELLKEPQRKPNAPRSLPPPTLILTTFFPGTSLLLNVKDDNSFPLLALYAPFSSFSILPLRRRIP